MTFKVGDRVTHVQTRGRNTKYPEQTLGTIKRTSKKDDYGYTLFVRWDDGTGISVTDKGYQFTSTSPVIRLLTPLEQLL